MFSNIANVLTSPDLQKTFWSNNSGYNRLERSGGASISIYKTPWLQHHAWYFIWNTRSARLDLQRI